MNKTFILAVIFCSFSTISFSQNKKDRQVFSVQSDCVSMARDNASVTYYIGNVTIKGLNFTISNADSVIYNFKEKTLSVFNCRSFFADEILVSDAWKNRGDFVIRLKQNY